jgi:hypothetical protein
MHEHEKRAGLRLETTWVDSPRSVCKPVSAMLVNIWDEDAAIHLRNDIVDERTDIRPRQGLPVCWKSWAPPGWDLDE